jgi:hypothetical protein
MEPDSYLKSDARVRFDARPSDVLVPAASGPNPVPGIDAGLVRRFFDLCDGERTLVEVADATGIEDEALARLLETNFGTTLFAPFAVLALERAVPSSEIVRFPGSPYEIERNYWANMAAVRSRVPRLLALADRASEALTELSALHGLALAGEDGETAYLPASPAAKSGVMAGRLWEAKTGIEETSEGALLTEGPRINAALVGGRAYFRLLAAEHGDALATEERVHTDKQGLAWGRLLLARAAGEELRPWFIPPRPAGDAHFQSLFFSLAHARDAAKAGDTALAIGNLAAFHRKFVLLHPFRVANQSLAMNVVNAVLAEAMGAGLPHLVLDQIALRFEATAYAGLFACAVRNWVVTGTPIERYRELTAKKQRYFAFVGRLADADDRAARAAAEESPADARLALVRY